MAAAGDLVIVAIILVKVSIIIVVAGEAVGAGGMGGQARLAGKPGRPARRNTTPWRAVVQPRRGQSAPYRPKRW